MTSLHDELEKKLQDPNATPMFLPLEFLKTITCDFSTESELGRGGYGVVYKGVLRSGKIIAVKKLLEIRLKQEAFQNEISFLMGIKHQNVVQFVGYCADSKWEAVEQPSGSGNHILAEIPNRLLCFEYVSNKSLDIHIADRSLDLEWNIRYKIIMGICNGLHFLHEECCIIHLDLKPENILMDSTMKPKIADFGLSRIFGEQQSKVFTDNRAGTCGYMAPEYLTRGLISKKADIFSLGVIIIEIVTGHRDYPYFQLDSLESTATSCQHFTEEVLGSWMYKFESTLEYISIEKYNNQVKECITIALKCVDPVMEKRPTVKDVIQVLNAVDQTEASKELPTEMQCVDKSLVLDTNLSKELTVHSITEDVSNIKTGGIEEDVKKSQERVLPTPMWTPSTGSQNHQEATESSEPQQAIDKTSEMRAHEELWPDLQSTDKLLVNPNTTASKNLAPHSVTEEMLINKTDDKVADEAKSHESLPPMPIFSESSVGIQDYQEVAEAFSEPQSAHDTTYETKVIPGSSMILDGHPPELCFHFGSNGLIACSLDLTNNTDAIMAFGVNRENKDEYLFKGLPKYGIVDPRTTYTLVLIVDTHCRFLLSLGRSVNLILQTSTYCKSSSYEETCEKHFQNAEQLGITVHQVTLKGVCPLQGKTIFELIPHSIKIISVREDYSKLEDYITSIDANQTEPLIITGNATGHVTIWNYDTQEYTGFIKTQEGLLGKLFGVPSVWCIKFISRMGWFVVGAGDVISVYNYKNMMQKVTSFKANSTLRSLAIHPTQPYALSTSKKGIQLWTWGQFGSKWKCMQVFKDQSDLVRVLAFNPEDHASFAGGCHDGTIKVWSLDSPICKYTLSRHSGLVCMEFFTRDGQQYLITGSGGRTAKIWDMLKQYCVHTLHHRSEVRCVLPHPTLPFLVTGAEDGHVYLWSSINFRLKRILKIHGRPCIQGLACLNESGRVVVAHVRGLSVIEISDEEEQGGSSSNNKNSESAAD